MKTLTRQLHRILCEHSRSRSYGYGVVKNSGDLSRGSVCKYVKKLSVLHADTITELKYLGTTNFLFLTASTLSNLEVTKSRSEGRKRTLLSVIDETITGMGSRLLHSWVLRPSIKRSEIQTRQVAIAELLDAILREKLRFSLRKVADIERLVGKLNLGSLSPRDLLALSGSIGQTPEINISLSDSRSLLLQVLSENIFDTELREL